MKVGHDNMLLRWAGWGAGDHSSGGADRCCCGRCCALDGLLLCCCVAATEGWVALVPRRPSTNHPCCAPPPARPPAVPRHLNRSAVRAAGGAAGAGGAGHRGHAHAAPLRRPERALPERLPRDRHDPSVSRSELSCGWAAGGVVASRLAHGWTHACAMGACCAGQPCRGGPPSVLTPACPPATHPPARPPARCLRWSTSAPRCAA